MTTDIIDSTDAAISLLTAKEKRAAQKAQLRPLANLRPELYDEDDYT